MKATGIVRRIDDLGRVVIPKEIRRTMRIREGDPLEIYTGAGEVVFKKYSPVGELSAFASQYAESLAEAASLPVLICDRDHCIAAAGISKKQVIGRRITPFLEETMEQRRLVKMDGKESQPALEGLDYIISVGAPITNSGDVCGAVVLINDGHMSPVTDTDIKLAGVAASFLGKQME